MTPEEREAIESEIRCLEADLLNSHEIGDFKIIKCYEASLLGEEMPYDYETLIAQRKAIRKKINELQEQLDE